MPSMTSLLEAYLLANDVAPTTEAWYRRIVSVFNRWNNGSDLTPDTLNRFLRDMRAKHSTYYCKSLRSGLLAILGDSIDRRKVRTVRLDRLRPASWTKDDVMRLVESAPVLPQHKRTYYRLICQFAWYTGLSQGDLHRIERQDFGPDGTLTFYRQKTGEHVVAWVPPALLLGLPIGGPLFPRHWSAEQFRKDFKRMVQSAQLVGTFKTLRKPRKKRKPR